MTNNKMEIFGRLCSQQEIENVFLKAKQYHEELKIYSEVVDQLRGEHQ